MSILEVKNLIISFRTNNGTVKAVRDISFSLDKSKTLAIVGESGSGKSVTARAIMGILAPNAIVEGGEIFFDGKDLLKIHEDDFHHIRGNRISMIFQDPLSSLNPIVRIGKQLIEAMLLNGKANQRDAKREYDVKMKLLEEACVEALAAEGRPDASAYVRGQMGVFKRFVACGNKLEAEYNTAYEITVGIQSDIEGILIDIINGEPQEVSKAIFTVASEIPKCCHPFLIDREKSGITALTAELKTLTSVYKRTGEGKRNVTDKLNEINKLIEASLLLEKPNYFRMGYYKLYCPDAKIEAGNVAELNALMLDYMNENFMDGFIKTAAAGIKFSADRSTELKRASLPELKQKLEDLDRVDIDAGGYRNITRALINKIEGAIDRLSINKDSLAYTFETSIHAAVEKYLRAKKLSGKKKLSKSERTFMDTADVTLCHNNIKLILKHIIEAYEAQLSDGAKTDYNAAAVTMVDHLKEEASRMVYRVSRRMAKARAIDLMEEVGIADARKRFRQYPFQFSGGMRQRIVIAIALAANPDILICDEPTTALDVTIQAQILDLINNLKRDRKLTVIFITHDLGVVANMADDIAVMYAGKIVEYGSAEDLFYSPAHPYTWALLSSMPDLDTKEKLEAIPGTPPNMIFPPVGDAFAARNKYAMQIDFEQQPPMFEISPTHKAATWLLHPDAPKIDPPKQVTDRIRRMKMLTANVAGEGTQKSDAGGKSGNKAGEEKL